MHIARLPSRKAGLNYPPGSSLRECLFPHILTSMGYYACGFIFYFTPRILCLPSQGREGPGSSLGPQGWILGHPQGGLLPTLLSAPALPTEAEPVAQMYLASLWGWVRSVSG